MFARYVLEVNPRASRTVPFVAKATGMPVAKIAAKVMAGISLAEQGVTERSGAAPRLGQGERLPVRQVLAASTSCSGPRCGSTGEVMGISDRFSIAFAKSQLAAGTVLPQRGQHLHQRRRSAKADVVELARKLVAMGFSLLATSGTAAALEAAGIPVHATSRSSKKVSPTCSTTSPIAALRWS